MRVLKQDLENLVERINLATGMALTPYSRVEDRSVPNAGNYHLEYAYGGVSLSRMSLTEGCTGTMDVIAGKGTKSELYYKMHAFLEGLRA